MFLFKYGKINCVKLMPGIMGILFMLFLGSCARTVDFHKSAVVPAAQGYVKVGKDDNRNYNIEVVIKRLAEPGRLSPAKNTYVVWVQTEKNGTKNIGQINTSTGLFSNKLRSSLKSVTPFKPVLFFITAEDEPNIQVPSSQVVLKTKEL